MLPLVQLLPPLLLLGPVSEPVPWVTELGWVCLWVAASLMARGVVQGVSSKCSVVVAPIGLGGWAGGEPSRPQVMFRILTNLEVGQEVGRTLKGTQRAGRRTRC